MQREALQRARGVRDFGPEEKIARDKIVETLKTVFEAFGYNPIETPILERYELFASKFGIGQESDAMRETFKLKDQGDRDLVLRTEFTVPFSRFVGMNPQLKKPFKRYQIGQVFRDGPLKLGRYREFYQCDVDVVGVSDPIIDAEILQLTDEVFTKLGLETEIFINNRKILNGILDACGVAKDDQNSVIISIDKLAKLGADGVSKELAGKG
ncbi:MAG: ATP phosphoribosyltransferase regulatory subunit, partial [Patescibacteria group bacterium]